MPNTLSFKTQFIFGVSEWELFYTLTHGAALALVNAMGERVVYPGQHTLIFQNGEGTTSNVTLQVEA